MGPVEVVLLITGGFIGKRFLREKHEMVIRESINYVLFPIFTFYNIAPQSLARIWTMKDAGFFGAIVPLLAISLAYVFTMDSDKDIRASVMMLSVFANVGALGIPMTSIFVNDTTPAIIFVQGQRVGFFLCIFVGSFYAHGNTNIKEILKDVFLFPPVIAALIAIIFPWELPEIVLKGLSYPESITLPIMLFYFGTRIKLAKPDLDMLWRVGLTRMLIPTTIVALITLLINLPSKITILIETSMPPAIYANLLIGEYGFDEERSVRVTMVLTIFSILILVGISVLWG